MIYTFIIVIVKENEGTIVYLGNKRVKMSTTLQKWDLSLTCFSLKKAMKGADTCLSK